jgi:hypothetical protein
VGGSLLADEEFRATVFHVIDFEATTPRGYRPEPIEIAVISLSLRGAGLAETARFTELMCPPRHAAVRPLDTSQTGVTPQMVATASTAAEVLAELDTRVATPGPRLLVAHHAPTEAGILMTTGSTARNWPPPTCWTPYGYRASSTRTSILTGWTRSGITSGSPRRPTGTGRCRIPSSQPRYSSASWKKARGLGLGPAFSMSANLVATRPGRTGRTRKRSSSSPSGEAMPTPPQQRGLVSAEDVTGSGNLSQQHMFAEHEALKGSRC